MTAEPSLVYDFDPRNLPPELLRAVGLITAASAQTEHIMQEFIGGLLGIDAMEAIALTNHMAGPLKDQVARALIELNGTSAWSVDTVDDLLDAIKAATDKRNILVHNALARHPETGEVFSIRYQARGSLSVSMQRVNIEQIEKDAALIYEAGINLMRFMLAFGITPRARTRVIHSPLNRGKKERKMRKDRKVGNAE
jgi:hypothetical protein